MLFNLQNSYASSKKLFSLLVDKNNAHQVHKYDVKNQIYLSLSPMFVEGRFQAN